MCKGGGFMKKYAKGLTLGAIAFAMAAGIHFQADAAVAAPNISLKEQTGSSQSVTSWTFRYADLQPGQTLCFNVYGNNDPKKARLAAGRRIPTTARRVSTVITTMKEVPAPKIPSTPSVTAT